MLRPHLMSALYAPPVVFLVLAACAPGEGDSTGETARLESGPLVAATPAAQEEAPPAPVFHSGTGADSDGDGYATSLDCDDTNAAINPGAVEADNQTDDDCDGWVDEDFVDPGDLVITEINRQARFGASTTNRDGSWIEVTNTSARTVDMSNWVFARGSAGTANAVTIDPGSAPVLAPGDYAVFCDTDNYQGSAGTAYPLACDYVWGDETQAASYVGTYHNNVFYLRRDNDGFALYVAGTVSTGVRVDFVHWTYDASNGYWPRDARFSTSLDPSHTDADENDDEANWCSTTASATGAVSYNSVWRWYDVTTSTRDEYGTPGALNYTCGGDSDGDGYASSDDCDDADATIHPGATETCNGKDDDCDGTIDDGVATTTYWRDADGDGYGDPLTSTTGCSAPTGYVANSSDCDDTQASAHPGGTEVCDGLDNDCDASVDEGLTSGSNVFYADDDADLYGDPAVSTTACTAPSGYVADGTDCDDLDPDVNPGATEADNGLDDDCDGAIDETFVDFGAVVVTEVNRQARFGGSVTVNDGSWVEVYNASDRTIDLAAWTLARGTSSSGNQIALDPASAPILAPGDYAVFCDSDNYQSSAGAAYPLLCDYVWGDETQASSYIGAYHDNTLYLRRDSDTVALYVDGNRTTGLLVDSVSWTYTSGAYWPRDARFSMSLDPAFVDATANDSVADWCSTTASATGAVANNTTYRWYDTSGTSNDEHGTPGAANYDCLTDNDGDGYTGTSDCDETDASIHVGATETCDGVDQDCDGLIDDGASGGTPWYADTDGDGYGDAGVSTSACSQPTGYVADATDCDDAEGTTYPGATEVCSDGVDNDCDPLTTCEWYGSQKVSDDYDFRCYGDTINYAVGTSIANNGDFDGDGYDDVVVGQSFWDGGATDNGRAMLFYGPVDSSMLIGDRDITIDGDTSRNSDWFGSSARFMGDLNGDGADELMVSAWKAGTDDRGTAYLFLGAGTPTTTANAWATFSTNTANDSTGQAIDAGDIDGNGVNDIVVSAYGRSSNAGVVGVWNSSAIGGGAENLISDASLVITGITAGDNLGYAASMEADLDNDGNADLIVGAPAASSTTAAGAVYVFYGVDGLSGTLSASTADAILTGSTAADRFGLSVAHLGDTDFDGQNDFVVTADKNDGAASDAGAAYVFTSAPTGTSSGASTASTIFRGEVATDYFGRTSAGIGDTNLDGYADMLVGATAWDLGSISGTGAAYLFYGPFATGTVSAAGYDARFTGSNTSDAVGYAVTGGGDVNADGHADFMISATSWDSFGLLNAGAAWLYYGASE